MIKLGKCLYINSGNYKNLNSNAFAVIFALLAIVVIIPFAVLAVNDSTGLKANNLGNLTTLAIAGVTEVNNSYMDIAVSDSTSMFTLGNTGGDPANPNDDNKILLYGHPNPRTSKTTVRIDGSDYIFGSIDGNFSQSPTKFPTYIKSVWISHNIQVTQVTALTSNPATGRVDVMQIRYMLENLDPINSHNVGLRVLLDTMLGGNDGAPFQIPGTGALTTEYEYTGSSIPDYWQAFDSLGNPTVLSQGTLRGGDATVPDRVIFASWPDFFGGSAWDYVITPGKIFGRTDYLDSSVGLYWNPKMLGAGQRIEYITYYGLSELSQDLRYPLSLSVTAPLNLSVINGAYSPNPFTVIAYVQNIESGEISGPINDISVAINLPAGLNLVGSPATQTISTLNPGEIHSLSWSVQASNQAVERLFSYDVTASASVLNGVTRKITRSILVPALAQNYDTTFRANPNGYQFPNFALADLSWNLFRNTYGADEVEINGQHRPRAQNFYDYAYRNTAAGGSCFGMAASSSVLFQNSLNGWNLGSNRTGALPSWSIFPPFLSTPTDWVEYYHPRQMDEASQADRNIYNSPTVVYNELKRRMASGNWIQDPMVIDIWFVGGGGHTVVPYRIEESGDHQQADVRIYDNNAPGQERTIHFNLTAGTASYGGNLNGVTAVSLSAIQQEPQMMAYDHVTSSGHLLYTNSNGKHLGYYNGEFMNEIPGAYKVKLSEQDGNQFPEMYYTSNLDIKRELVGINDSNVTVSISRSNNLIKADVHVAAGSINELRVPDDGSNIEFISGRSSSSLGLTLDREIPAPIHCSGCIGLARVASVDGIEIGSGSSVKLLFSEDLNEVGFKNNGTKKNYTMQLEQIGANSGNVTISVPIEVQRDSTNWITPQNWSDLGNSSFTVQQDIGNDGTIDNTTVIPPGGLPKTGDINGNGQLTLVDAIYLAKHVGGFSGYGTIYADGDINGNGQVTLVDAIYLAKHIGGFTGYETIY